ALPAALEQPRKEKLSHTTFLERLLKIEVEATEARRLAGRLRFASLPAPWTLADFDFDAQPALDRKLVDELATLRFVEEAANLLLVGPPGVGKTMLAICLARQAVEAGHPARRFGSRGRRACGRRPRWGSCPLVLMALRS